MIRFNDPKYGFVIICELCDILCKWREFGNGELGFDSFRNLIREDYQTASIIGFRNREKNYVKVLKNRYAPLDDFVIDQLIFNYGVEKEKEEHFEPVESRFEILDL